MWNFVTPLINKVAAQSDVFNYSFQIHNLIKLMIKQQTL